MKLAAIEETLREHALTFPEVTEDFPWGHRAMKVKGKVFVFIVLEKSEVTVSLKLPQSRDIAIDLPFTEPTGYGMGKHGWVTAHIKATKPPLDLIKAWITESYRAIAPKKLVKALDA
jgi:predicted DNA-binding protein (MmcQ/YjbR family)